MILDIETIREQNKFTGLITCWVNTKQMLVDCLTMDDPKAGDYLRYMVKTGYFHLTFIAGIDFGQACCDSKYSGRRSKKEISMEMFNEDGWSTSWDAVCMRSADRVSS